MIHYSNGDYYYGQLKNGYFHGHGQLHSKELGIYEGEWIKGNKANFGKLIDTDSCVYEGNFKNNMKNGKGK